MAPPSLPQPPVRPVGYLAVLREWASGSWLAAAGRGRRRFFLRRGHQRGKKMFRGGSSQKRLMQYPVVTSAYLSVCSVENLCVLLVGEYRSDTCHDQKTVSKPIRELAALHYTIQTDRIRSALSLHLEQPIANLFQRPNLICRWKAATIEYKHIHLPIISLILLQIGISASSDHIISVVIAADWVIEIEREMNFSQTSNNHRFTWLSAWSCNLNSQYEETSSTFEWCSLPPSLYGISFRCSRLLSYDYAAGRAVGLAIRQGMGQRRVPSWLNTKSDLFTDGVLRTVAENGRIVVMMICLLFLMSLTQDKMIFR